jgi:hypothetical protein
MEEGRCGEADVFVGVQSIHIKKSMSWQDFVRREGAEVDSLRQLPLWSSVTKLQEGVMLPDVAVTEMPPSNRLTVLDAENVSYGLLLSYQMSQ